MFIGGRFMAFVNWLHGLMIMDMDGLNVMGNELL